MDYNLLLGSWDDRSFENSVSLISFVMDGVHPHDIGTVLDLEGVAIRTGHHCCMPLMQALGVPATARASLSFYNTKDEIDVFITGLKKVRLCLLVQKPYDLKAYKNLH